MSGFNNKLYQDKFSKTYYNFLTANVINPHFGFYEKLTFEAFILPLKCIVNTELHINSDIVSKLYLRFNSPRNKIDIYFNYTKIGHIDINIDDVDIIVMTHIELDNPYRKKNIAVNVLFVLMEILASYYAPLNISLKMAFVKPMFQIAHTLQFNKMHSVLDKKGAKNENENKNKNKNEEYYIRLCRI